MAVGLVLAASACEPTDLPLPSDAEAQAYFQASSTVSVRVNGNVAEITDPVGAFITRPFRKWTFLMFDVAMAMPPRKTSPQ